MALKKEEYEQLVSHIFGRVEEALATNARQDMRECLEEISDLTDSEASLIFNDDGTVEIEPEEEGAEVIEEEDDE